MKFLFDYFPVICFFIAFKLWGIYTATAVAMGASSLQVGLYWLRHRRFEKLHLITLVLLLILGGSTLLLHQSIFIKWKPTIIYWAFTTILLSSQWLGSKRPIIHRMLKDKITLPAKVWLRLNLSWAIFFLLLGLLNLYVVYHFNTNTWVNFQLFGTLGLTILFVMTQASYIAKYAKDDKILPE